MFSSQCYKCVTRCKRETSGFENNNNTLFNIYEYKHYRITTVNTSLYKISMFKAYLLTQPLAWDSKCPQQSSEQKKSPSFLEAKQCHTHVHTKTAYSTFHASWSCLRLCPYLVIARDYITYYMCVTSDSNNLETWTWLHNIRNTRIGTPRLGLGVHRIPGPFWLSLDWSLPWAVIVTSHQGCCDHWRMIFLWSLGSLTELLFSK